MNHLPSGWLLTNLGEISDYVQRGKSPKYVASSELPVVNQKCVRWHGVDDAYLKFVDPAQWAAWAPERFLRPGDILWNSTGTGTIGRAAFFTGLSLYDRAVADSHVTIIRPSSEVEGRYLQLFIKSPAVQSRMDEMQNGSTGQVELSREQVVSTEIPLPPRLEQRRIVSKVDSLCARSKRAREHLDHVPNLLKRYKDAVLKAAFDGSLTQDFRSSALSSSSQNHAGILDIAENESHNSGRKQRKTAPVLPLQAERMWSIPSSWQWCQVGDCAFVTKLAGFEYTKLVKYDPSGDLRVLKAENAGPNGFRETDYSLVFAREVNSLSRTRLHGGELLVVFVGAGTGNVAIVPSESEFFLGPNIAMARPNNSIVSSRYMELFFRYSGGKSLLMSSTKAVAQPSLSMGAIRSTPIAVPQVTEQNEIVRRVNAAFVMLDRLASEASSARKLIDHLDQAILSKAFRGELVPQDPDDEPASVLLERIKAAEAGSASSGKRRGRPHTATLL